MIELKTMQKDIARWRKKNFPHSGTVGIQMIGVMEEVGEVCHLILKKDQKIRGPSLMSNRQWKEEMKDGVGDIVVYLMNLCTLASIDIEEAIKSTVEMVLARDWDEWRKKHGTA